jgi:hypothetical protein
MEGATSAALSSWPSLKTTNSGHASIWHQVSGTKPPPDTSI